MTEPTTPTGRRVLLGWADDITEEDILAIEREAREQDAELLRLAAIGRAVERLAAKDAPWMRELRPGGLWEAGWSKVVTNEDGLTIGFRDFDGTGPDLPAAIAAALGDE